MYNSFPSLPQYKQSYSNKKEDDPFQGRVESRNRFLQQNINAYPGQYNNNYNNIESITPYNGMKNQMMMNRQNMIAQYSNKILDTLKQSKNDAKDRYYQKRMMYDEVVMPGPRIKYQPSIPMPFPRREEQFDDFEKEMKLRIFRKKIEEVNLKKENDRLRHNLFNEGYILSKNNSVMAKIGPVDDDTWKQLYQLKKEIQIEDQVKDRAYKALVLKNFYQREKKLKIKQELEEKAQQEEIVYFDPKSLQNEDNRQPEVIELKDQIGRRRDIILDIEEINENLQEDLEKLQQELNRQKRLAYYRQRARIFHARFAFVILYFNEIRRTILNKQELQYEDMNSNIAATYRNLMKFLQSNCYQPLQKVCQFPKKTPKDFAKISGFALEFLHSILVNLNEFSIDRKSLIFLGRITHDYQFPPQYFLYRYEVNRLNYTAFGALCDMNQGQTLMILFCFFFIRVVILQVLRDPLDVNPQLTLLEADGVQVSFQTLASYIYFQLVELLNANVPIQENNQIQLQVQLQIKEKPNITQFSDVQLAPDQTQAFTRDPNFIITGLDPKEDFQLFLEDQKNQGFIDQFQSVLICIGEKFVNLTDEIFQQEKVQEKQDQIADAMNDQLKKKQQK